MTRRANLNPPGTVRQSIEFTPWEFTRMKLNYPGPSGRMGGYQGMENILVTTTNRSTLVCELSDKHYARLLKYLRAHGPGGPNDRMRDACIPALERQGIFITPIKLIRRPKDIGAEFMPGDPGDPLDGEHPLGGTMPPLTDGVPVDAERPGEGGGIASGGDRPLQCECVAFGDGNFGATGHSWKLNVDNTEINPHVQPSRDNDVPANPGPRRAFHAMNLSAALVKEVLNTVSTLAKQEGLTVEKYVGVVVSFDSATATVRSSEQEREAVMDTLRDIIAANPDAEFHSKQMAAQLGLKQCRADMAWLSRRAKMLRLEHHEASGLN